MANQILSEKSYNLLVGEYNSYRAQSRQLFWVLVILLSSLAIPLLITIFSVYNALQGPEINYITIGSITGSYLFYTIIYVTAFRWVYSIRKDQMKKKKNLGDRLNIHLKAVREQQPQVNDAQQMPAQHTNAEQATPAEAMSGTGAPTSVTPYALAQQVSAQQAATATQAGVNSKGWITDLLDRASQPDPSLPDASLTPEQPAMPPQPYAEPIAYSEPPYENPPAQYPNEPPQVYTEQVSAEHTNTTPNEHANAQQVPSVEVYATQQPTYEQPPQVYQTPEGITYEQQTIPATPGSIKPTPIE